MPAFKRDNASRLREAERCMKAGEPLTVREASFISLLMGHTPNTVLELFGIAKHLSLSLSLTGYRPLPRRASTTA